MQKWKQLIAAILLTMVVVGCGGTTQAPSSGEAPADSSAAAQQDDAFPTSVAIPEDSPYVDFSSDRSTIFFNTTGSYNQTVFFDFFYPFDTSLKLNHYDALTKYQLDHEIWMDGETLMVSLEDLQKLYAPYFTYGIEDNTLTVRHILFTKTVHPEDSGLRSPRLNYTKTIWEAAYPLGETGQSP